VTEAVTRWRDFATSAGVLSNQIQAVGGVHRLDLAPS